MNKYTDTLRGRGARGHGGGGSQKDKTRAAKNLYCSIFKKSRHLGFGVFLYIFGGWCPPIELCSGEARSWPPLLRCFFSRLGGRVWRMRRRRDEDPRNPPLLLLLLSFTVWNSVRPEYRNLELSVNGNLTRTENIEERFRIRSTHFKAWFVYLETVLDCGMHRVSLCSYSECSGFGFCLQN